MPSFMPRLSMPRLLSVCGSRGGDVRFALLSRKALDAIYAHISAVRIELQHAAAVFIAARDLKACASDDPKRELHAKGLSGCLFLFQSRRTAIQSLPLLPELP